MNKNWKLAIGVGIAAAAVTVLTIGVMRKLKAITSLTIEAEELPEDLDLSLEEAADEEEAE